ncbi:MAG: DUF559 domain-containing protein [Chloroflexota bacterium]
MPQRFILRGQKVTKDKIALAKEIRSKMTEAEEILWQSLRANRLDGWHFRRQQILYGYIVDFYCHAASLIIEVDGEIHENQRAADLERGWTLADKGFHIIRIQNKDVFKNLPFVLDRIRSELRRITISDPASRPLPYKGRGMGG